MTYGAPPTAYPPPQGPPPQGPWHQQSWPQEVVSPEGRTRRGGFLGFMTSLPGVLTAVAGLVTAATGGVGLYLSQDDGPSRGGDTIIIEADPVPQGNGEVDAEGLDAGLSETSGDDEVTALVDGCLSGDPSACDTLLYLLAEECYTGYLISCDALYQISAYGSSFEDYGATCGGRHYDWAFAGVCSSAATL